MRLLVFQHIDSEHPGSFRSFLAKDQAEWTPVNLHRGEQIPPLEQYDALWVMGGPMDVWEVDEHPWLISEKAAIRQWVRDLGKPFLGLCLGHQLLADALGGTCGPQQPSEIGIFDVELTTEGQADPLLIGTPTKQKCLQWHSVRVAQEPENAVILASSRDCRVQAMRVGENAWSMQYHAEIEPDTVENWSNAPAYHDVLMATIGVDGVAAMKQDAAANMSDFLDCAHIIYRNFTRRVEQ